MTRTHRVAPTCQSHATTLRDSQRSRKPTVFLQFQGAALHYVDGKNGIKDFDVWSFYDRHPEREFPPRRVASVDFGDPKIGRSSDRPKFVGRRVDLIGRSIRDANWSDPVETLRHYLRAGATSSARFLARKAVVLLEPAPLRGTVVWRPPQSS